MSSYFQPRTHCLKWVHHTGVVLCCRHVHMPSIFTLEIVERARMKTAGDLLTASPRGWGKRGDMFFRRFALRSRALRSLQCTRFVRMLVDFRKEKENNVLYRLIQRLTSNSNITTITQFVWASCVARDNQALSAEIPNTLVFHRNFACTSIYFEQRHI